MQWKQRVGLHTNLWISHRAEIKSCWCCLSQEEISGSIRKVFWFQIQSIFDIYSINVTTGQWNKVDRGKFSEEFPVDHCSLFIYCSFYLQTTSLLSLWWEEISVWLHATSLSAPFIHLIIHSHNARGHWPSSDCRSYTRLHRAGTRAGIKQINKLFLILLKEASLCETVNTGSLSTNGEFLKVTSFKQHTYFKIVHKISVMSSENTNNCHNLTSNILPANNT